VSVLSNFCLQKRPHSLSVVVRRKGKAKARDKGHLIIKVAHLSNLSLYSKHYQGFILKNWPPDLEYPEDAKALQPFNPEGSIKQWYPYRILKAFCVGSQKGHQRLLMKFSRMEWSKCRFSFKFIKVVKYVHSKGYCGRERG
jgi:hypothetical protein